MQDRPVTDADEVWHETPRGRPADLSLLAMSGVDLLRTFLDDGGSPSPPVARLSGRRLITAEAGSVAYTLPKSEWFVSGKGRLHPGVLAFLADAALTGAVQSALAARTVCTTAELSMTFTGAPPRAGGEVTAEARCIHVDSEMGLAEVFVRDDDGTLAAHGTSRTVVHPPIADDVPLDPSDAELPDDTATDASPDPHGRPVPDAPSTTEDLSRLTGLGILQAVIAGDLPRPPVDRLFGVRLVEAEENRVVFTLPAHGWLVNEFGTVYGGMIAHLAKSAAAAAVQTIAPRGTRYTALDLKVNFLRPVPPDGAELAAVGTVLHRGRHLVISSSEVTHGGRTVAIATGTTALHSPNGA